MFLGTHPVPLKCLNSRDEEPLPNTPASPWTSPRDAGAAAPGVVKRRWPRRTLITANGVVFLCLAAMASAYGYVRYEIGSVVTDPART